MSPEVEYITLQLAEALGQHLALAENPIGLISGTITTLKMLA